MRGWTALLKPWVLSVLALSLGPGCGGAGAPPVIGPNLIRNGSFEEAKLEPAWWTATEKDGTATVSPEAADLGNRGLVLHKGTVGWGAMVGQETEPHQPGETYQVRARLKGAQGAELVTLSFHGQGFEVQTEPRWRTVSRLLLLPEASDNVTALISVTTDDSTVYVDDVSFARAEVARGEADEEEGNLLRNGSFESDLGMWSFWTDAGPEGTASTSPDARQSGYAGMVLSKGPEGSGVAVKQQLRDPLAEGEEYRLEAHMKGTVGGEAVALCVQINHEPWDGPCVPVNATTGWTHVSEKLTFDPALTDERVGVLVSLLSEGTVLVDDVILVRTRAGR
jgi:hypothetical protein